MCKSDADGLRRALTPVHQRYAGHIHARRKCTGHFWQGSHGAVPMDEDYLATGHLHFQCNMWF